MDATRWNRVKDVFAQALEKSGADRESFLSSTCAGDLELRAEVDSLLASHQDSASLLDAPAAAYFSGAALPDSDEGVLGQRLGPYRLVSVIAAGGMGAVYLAERADEEFEQQVAIKLIRPGFDSGQFLRRFLNERQTLAHLDHPHIAKLLDGGTAEDGRPYLVMEYIEGLPLDRFCEDRELGLEKRLDLFREVCGAVRYAHQNLVVHRDLKPGNILVTHEGVPKLLDFGIAKLLDPGLRAAGVATVEPLQALTPYYASPEQVRGDAITTASDIYSLGVILYQLLTGELPYELKTLAPAELLRVVGEEQPPPPSSALRNRAKAGSSALGSVPSDLDAIVLMALRKEPQRRYGSVEEFAADVERFQTNRPVVAGPDSFAYHAVKFLRRNRAAVVGSVLLAASLVGGIISTTWQAAIARTEATIATQVSELLVGIFEFSDPWKQTRGAEQPVSRLLESGVEKLEEREDLKPEIRASLFAVLGRVYQKLEDDPGSVVLLERAVELYRQEAHDFPEKQAEALHLLGIAQRRMDEAEAAEETLREALRLRRQVYGDRHEEVAATWNALGTALAHQGKFAEAERAYEQALEMRRRLHGEDHELVALSLSNLGDLAYDQGRERDEAAERQELLLLAEGRFREAVRIDRAALGEHLDLATVLNNLGMTLRELGRDQEAEESLRESLDMRRRLHGESHPQLATSLNNVGTLLYDRGDYLAAAELFQEAFDMVREPLGEDHLVVQAIRGNLEAARAEIDAEPVGG